MAIKSLSKKTLVIHEPESEPAYLRSIYLSKKNSALSSHLEENAPYIRAFHAHANQKQHLNDESSKS